MAGEKQEQGGKPEGQPPTQDRPDLGPKTLRRHPDKMVTPGSGKGYQTK